jgi:hypothetical protein
MFEWEILVPSLEAAKSGLMREYRHEADSMTNHNFTKSKGLQWNTGRYEKADIRIVNEAEGGKQRYAS